MARPHLDSGPEAIQRREAYCSEIQHKAYAIAMPSVLNGIVAKTRATKWETESHAAPNMNLP